MFQLLTKSYYAITGLKVFWKILNNWYFLKQSFSEIEVILKELIIDKKPPSCEQSKKLVGILKTVLEREIIDFPGIDEIQLAKELNKFETNLICRAPDYIKPKGT